jgi:hypothetical protein
MKIFVISQNYPSKDNLYEMSFVHSRVKSYIKNAQDVIVISFLAEENYIFDEVKIVTKNEGKKLLKLTKNNIVMMHAPNIRNGVIFIFTLLKYIKYLILFFHGHEVLNTKLYYPKPYNYDIKGKRKRYFSIIYDYIKLPVMKITLKYLNSHTKLDLVFVSNWMYSAFNKSLNYTQSEISKFQIHIINNPISRYINQCGYTRHNNVKADFISIRPLDGAKYAVDLIIDFALSNPEYTFHIYGKGIYFKHNIQPPNVEVFNFFIYQKDIPQLLNNYKYALMPTKVDAQGVMMCEMAYYGIPILVSDLPVCREMLEEFDNVRFINNGCFNRKYDIEFFPNIKSSFNNKFSIQEISKQELSLINSLSKS